MKHITILTVFVLLLGFGAVFSNELQADAATAATMNNACKISSITSTDTSITLKWTERYRDGSMVLTYGTTNPPTTERAVNSTERNARVLSITGLQPATTYYVQIVASKTGETSYGASSSIATLNSTGVKNSYQSSGPSVAVIQNDRTIVIQSSDRIDMNSLVLINVAGQKAILQNGISLDNGHKFSFRTDAVAKGRYILKISAKGANIDRIIIIR